MKENADAAGKAGAACVPAWLVDGLRNENDEAVAAVAEHLRDSTLATLESVSGVRISEFISVGI